jgi:glycosyltransferase involved in cell wall biosynthesis
MHVFHIPSWFPNRHEKLSGISSENLIRCISDLYPDVLNSVSLIQESSYRWLLKDSNLLREIWQYLFASKKVVLHKEGKNLNYLYAPKSIVYSNQLGFNEWEHDYNFHKRNLEFCIRNFGKPDIIHAQVTYTGGYCAYRLHQEFNIPYIITERYAPFPHPSFSQNGKLVTNVLTPLEEAMKVVSVSPAFAKVISDCTGREVLAIPNFLDENFFKPASDPVSTTDFVFGTLAVTYEPRKGIDLLLKAIRKLKDRKIKVKFKIGGGNKDNDYINLKKLEDELQVSDYVEWFDKINRADVVKFMQSCDCFVMPSLSESFGTVYIEAIACGKPVIATKCGGPESIVDDSIGLLVNVGDVDNLVDALIHMIEHKSDYSEEICRNYFLDHFSKQVVTKQYMHLYNNVVNK